MLKQNRVLHSCVYAHFTVSYVISCQLDNSFLKCFIISLSYRCHDVFMVLCRHHIQVVVHHLSNTFRNHHLMLMFALHQDLRQLSWWNRRIHPLQTVLQWHRTLKKVLDASYSGSFENLHGTDIHGQPGPSHQQPNTSPPLPSFADTYSVNVSGSYTCLPRDELKTESISSLANFNDDSSPNTPCLSMGSSLHHRQHPQQPAVMHYHGQYQMITEDRTTCPDASLVRHHPHAYLSSGVGNLAAFAVSSSDQMRDYFGFSKHHQQHPQSGNGYQNIGIPTSPYPTDSKDAVFTHPTSFTSTCSSGLSGNPLTSATAFQSPYFEEGPPPCPPVSFEIHGSQAGSSFIGSEHPHHQRHASYQRRSSLSSMGSPLSPE